MTNKKHIWASLDDYLLPPAGLERVGRNMANNFFFRALMRHGTFDEYHFFLANSAHRNLFMENHGKFLEEVGLPGALFSFSLSLFGNNGSLRFATYGLDRP